MGTIVGNTPVPKELVAARLFGTFELRRSGVALSGQTSVAASLGSLEILLLNLGTPVSKDQILKYCGALGPATGQS